MKHNHIINARGTYTPLGVSRSSQEVAASASEALQNFYDIDQLLENFSTEVCGGLGVEAATLTHCTAASITLSVAAVMCLDNPELVPVLPNTEEPKAALIQGPHVINYGQSILQAIGLSGAEVRVVGSSKRCNANDLEAACSAGNAECLVLVDSRLSGDGAVDLHQAIAIARRHELPTILDAAAQDLRLAEVLSYGADLTLISMQKYLAGPTAGLLLGRRDLVEGVRSQFKGIGRGMKATKEAIFGSLTAIAQRKEMSLNDWSIDQNNKNQNFIGLLADADHISSAVVEDPNGSPFGRVQLRFYSQASSSVAVDIAKELNSGDPPVYVFDDKVSNNEITLELVLLTEKEVSDLAARVLDVSTRVCA